jgi:hypothetical protein
MLWTHVQGHLAGRRALVGQFYARRIFDCELVLRVKRCDV